MGFKKKLAFALLTISSNLVCAQSADEVVLLINDASPASIAIAHEYAKLRNIPESHLIRCSLPDYQSNDFLVSKDDFLSKIFDPTLEAINNRGLSGRIRAWIYSVDFPAAVEHTPRLSLHGMTFVRGNPPSADLIQQGQFASPFYSSPINATQATPHAPRMSWWPSGRFNQPIPAWSLGYTRSRGNTPEEVLASLERGKLSESTRPEGSFIFQTSENIRAKARAWQYPQIIKELESLSQEASIRDKGWPVTSKILGYQLGLSWFSLGPWHFKPGAFVEHLTSHGAEFQSNKQFKISQWIRMGATASAGTVVEPMAIWTKFPHASFYTHLVRGHSLMESLYLSVRCPLQLYAIGDPLARPFTNPSSATLKKSENGNVLTLSLDPAPHPQSINSLYINGLPQGAKGNQNSWRVLVSELPQGNVNFQAYSSAPESNKRPEQYTAHYFNPIPPSERLDLKVNVTKGNWKQCQIEVEWNANDSLPKKIRLMHGMRTIVETLNTKGQKKLFSPDDIGYGPMSLYLEANLQGGKKIRSNAVAIDVPFSNTAPTRKLGSKNNLSPSSWQDDDGDTLQIQSLEQLLPSELYATTEPFANKAWEKGQLLEGGVHQLIINHRDTLHTELTFPSAIKGGQKNIGFAGLMYNRKSENTFDFAGWSQKDAAWIAATVKGGRWSRHDRVAKPLLPNDKMHLALRKGADGRLSFSVNGETLFSLKNKLSKKLACGVHLEGVGVKVLGIYTDHESTTTATHVSVTDGLSSQIVDSSNP